MSIGAVYAFDTSAEITNMPPMSVQKANMIDLLAFDQEVGELVLGMNEPRPWDGSHQRGYELQEKINAYLSFALDGEMHTAFPQFADKPLRIHLECRTEPDPQVAEFIEAVRQQIAFQGIQFTVKVNPELVDNPEENAAAQQGGCCGGGGHSCGCHAPEPSHAAHDHQHHHGHGGCGCEH